MDNEDIKERIVEILDRTFQVIDQCYFYNDEASNKADFSKVGSRLVFPCYSKQYRQGERRLSEQELRFLFIEKFNQYCQYTGWDVYYSVETPTDWKYRFSGVKRPQKVENGDDGQSAMIDVCVHNNQGERICLIEFKAGNPEAFCYEKDFVKLTEEHRLSFFVQLLERQNSGTEKSIIDKIKKCVNDTNYVCHTIESNYRGTKFISTEGIDKDGWEPLSLS
jgi:hypothetical protein